MTYDVMVVGGGPAGLSAAQNVRARGRTVLVVSNPLEENPLWKAERVDNYLGLPGVSGAELLTAFRRHAEAAGAEIKALAQSGFDAAGDGKGFPYVLVTRGDRELEDDAVYRVVFLVGGYTEETAERLHIDTVECQLQAALRAYLAGQGTVSPGSGSYE